MELGGGVPPNLCEYALSHHLHLPDRAALAEATTLILQFGSQAAAEAAMRAERSRSLGNLIHFCRWRTIERTIGILSAEEATGTVH